MQKLEQESLCRVESTCRVKSTGSQIIGIDVTEVAGNSHEGSCKICMIFYFYSEKTWGSLGSFKQRSDMV